MSIKFTSDQWLHVKESSNRWWAGDLDRPLIPVRLHGRDPDRAKPDVPLLSQSNCHDFSISPDQVIDRIDYELSTSCPHSVRAKICWWTFSTNRAK